MAKRKSSQARQADRSAKAAQVEEAPLVALKVGDHQFPAFTGIDAVFGANGRDYPAYEAIPNEHRRGSRYGKVFSALFYTGGTLEQHGLKLRSGVHPASFYTTMRALMSSFAPKHEIKEATVAWLLAEHTEPVR